MFADGSHLGWRSGSQDIILKADHLRTIHAMFALKMATISGHSFNIGSYGKYVQKSSPLKPVSQFKAWMVLKWSFFSNVEHFSPGIAPFVSILIFPKNIDDFSLLIQKKNLQQIQGIL
jgi:hypothetical protein